LKIDGEPVCEVDYQYLHPALLHAEEGLQLDYDPYEVDGYPRSIVKVAFQILINTEKPFPPVRSLNYFLNKNKRKKKNWHNPVWTDLKIDDAYCLELAQAIAERNKPIAHHFSKGVGLRLQHTDSILVSAVIFYMHKETADTLVLPVHDSFVVKQSDLGILMKALEFAERFLAKFKGQILRDPVFKATVLQGLEIDSYNNTIEEYKLEGSNTSTYNKEELVKEVYEFLESDDDDYDSFEFDAVIED
jgi:hypothetical protein